MMPASQDGCVAADTRYSPRVGGMLISATGSLAVSPSNSLRVMASAWSIE